MVVECCRMEDGRMGCEGYGTITQRMEAAYVKRHRYQSTRDVKDRI